MLKINELYCKGCGYCIKFCPRGVLEMGRERNQRGLFYPVAANEDKCTTCGICAAMCPEAVIELLPKE